MRRSALVLVTLTLAGCGVLRDAFSAHTETVGTAAGQTLTVTRLAELVGKAKRVPLRADVLTGLADVYLDYAVFAVELASGRDLEDSSLILRAEWPTVSQIRWDRFHGRLAAAHAKMSRAQTDSAYEAGAERLFQHILIGVPPNSPPTVEQEKRREAERLHAQLGTGGAARFAALAKQHSEDGASKGSGGYLPIERRGQFVPAFDSAAWKLAPGAVSGVVRSPFGFHIIRRPALEEVRDSFQAALQTARMSHFDSLYVDSLAKARDLKVTSSAPARVRQAVPQIVAAQSDDHELATYHGGTFRVRDLARWMLALNPNDVRGIAMATDAQLTQFVRVLAQREILLQQVDSAGVTLTPDDWKQVRAEYDSALQRVEQFTGLSPEVLRDSASSQEQRIAFAMRHVNEYLDRAIGEGAVPFVPVPPLLATQLRRGHPWSVDEAGIARAVERAQEIRGPAAPPGMTPAPAPPPGALKRAPGPPPVPPSGAKRP